MRIYIPTRGRAHKQSTWNNLPAAWKEITQLVVDADEAHLHGNKPLLVLPNGVSGLNGMGQVRQWLMENADAERVLMLDDDLHFYYRRTDEPDKMKMAEDEHVHKLLSTMYKTLTGYAHAGIAAKQGSNNNVGKVIFNSRIMRALGFNRDLYLKHDIRFDRLKVMEDFDVNLQFLRKGVPTVILNMWAQDHGASQADGGCSLYRTNDVHTEGAHALKALHPEFVNIVKKTTKGAWGGGERTDVMIYWKKAFLSSGAVWPTC